ncbi:multiple sugar transport system substrate-binding protein [Actimicrobium sp. GrIS 1.19]|nr:multiple sugar transport system substrate-binding protein [Actimicrobium sp. GrIS 1.19]
MSNSIAEYIGRLIIATMLIACLTSCENKGESKAALAQPQTLITALIWAPDWPREMDQIAEEFTKANPQIRVNVQFMIGNSVEENLMPKVGSRALPDLMSVNPNAFTARLADQKLLMDLGDTAAWTNMLEPLKGDWTSPANHRFGITAGVATTAIFFNKDLFQRAGISSLPTNFDEFLAVCEKLKKAGITPIMWNGGFANMLGNGPFSSGFANNIVGAHANWKRSIADGSLNLDSAATADIFSKIKLVAQRGYVQDDFMSTNYDQGIKLFTEGKTAMAFHGTWAAGLLMHGKGFQTGLFMPPWNTAGKLPVPVVGSETGFAVANAANRKEAMAFLEFIVGKGFSIQQNKRQNIPAMKQVDGVVVNDVALTEYMRVVNQMPVSASPYYAFLPASTLELVHSLMQEVLFGNITPQQAASSLDASIKGEAEKTNK